MSLSTLLARASRRPVHGRPLRRSARRRISRRDPARRNSDTVWALVERMMGGDADAATELDEIIGGGFTAGATRFTRITSRSWKRSGHVYPGKIIKNHFAAITPRRQIVLFGMEHRFAPGERGWVYRGYVRRFKMGDLAEYHAYNYVYVGRIVSISDKRVIIEKELGARGGEPPKASLDIETFDTKNHDFDLETIKKRNADTSLHI